MVFMDSVDEDLGLVNGNKAVLLTDTGIASQAVCGLVDGLVDGRVICHVNMEGRVLLGELGPVGVVGGTIIVEAIEAAAPGHALVSPHKELEA